MNNQTLEERIQHLEKLINERKSPTNEFLGFGGPKKSDEPVFIKKLFSKYPTLRDALIYKDDSTGKRANQAFHLFLHTGDKYNNIHFIIASTTNSKRNMYCSAFYKNNIRIDTLKSFNLDKDINTVAKFILEILQKNKVSWARESRGRKLESVSLSGSECESIRQYIEDSIYKNSGEAITVETDNRYAYNGILTIRMYDQELDLLAEYTITVDSFDRFSAESEGKVVSTASSLDDIEDEVIEHFLDNYV